MTLDCDGPVAVHIIIVVADVFVGRYSQPTPSARPASPLRLEHHTVIGKLLVVWIATVVTATTATTGAAEGVESKCVGARILLLIVTRAAAPGPPIVVVVRARGVVEGIGVGGGGLA